MTKYKKNMALALLFLVVGFMAASAYSTEGKININTATKQELMTLKNVGEVTAEKIIEYRKVHPFQVPEDIMKVKGVGKKTYEVNKDRICCSD